MRGLKQKPFGYAISQQRRLNYYAPPFVTLGPPIQRAGATLSCGTCKRIPDMTSYAELLAARSAPRSAIDVEILSVATAVPAHVTGQQDIAERAHKIYPQYARLDALYTNTGIERRYSVEPKEWYLQTHTWEERTDTYQRNALDLLETVAVQAVKDAGLNVRDIDTIVTNTITGLAIPSLEARLMNRLGFRPDVQRLPIFGLGCGGGVAGISRAARMAQAQPGSNVLFLTVDLCSLCLRINDPSLTMFVAAALFGDGAAGVVLRSPGGGHAARGNRRGAARAHPRLGRILLVEHRAHHGLRHQKRWFRHRVEPGASRLDARALGRGAVAVFCPRGPVAG